MATIVPLILSNFLVSGNEEYTSCNKVLEEFHPTQPACSQDMTCEGTDACYVSEDTNCTFDCFPPNECPVGSTYLPFVKETQSCNVITEGYACYPYLLECTYMQDNALEVNIIVSNINNQTGNDTRIVSLISYDNYLEREPNNVFINSSCHGEPNGEKVKFIINLN